MRSKLCDFVSTDKDVVRYDRETYAMIKPQDKTMLESEMVNKTKTRFKTYMELKVNTKMSDVIWDDSINLRWEQLENFFLKFGM